MPTQNVSLSDQQVRFIRTSISHGRFRNASEVVRAALYLLEQEERQNKVKLEHMRRLVKEGFDEIHRGEYEVITKDTLAEFLDTFRTSPRSRKSS
jgi:antitoxin ParD1/3/4